MTEWLSIGEILNPGTQSTLSSLSVALWHAFIENKILALSYNKTLFTRALECLAEKPQGKGCLPPL